MARLQQVSAGVVPKMPVTVDRMRVEIRHRIIVFLQVHVDSETNTPEIGPAGLLPRLFPHSPQRRHQDRQQNGNDSNNNEKLDQRKSALSVHLLILSDSQHSLLKERMLDPQ